MNDDSHRLFILTAREVEDILELIDDVQLRGADNLWNGNVR